MDVASNENVGVCWNCNQEDLDGKGFDYNFDLLKNRFGDTVHIRELNSTDYPYDRLMQEFIKMKYNGWLLLECRTDPEDTIKAMAEQKQIFDNWLQKGFE